MVIKHSKGTTPIRFSNLEHAFDDLDVQHPIVTDTNVAAIYDRFLTHRKVFAVQAGESSKSIAESERGLRWLAEHHHPRSMPIVALGGGVVGDLAGFIASIYMRGVPLIQVPTSLLAQVDSSVGGKVGVDLPEGKNLVGSFWPATEVIVAHDFLDSLPRRELLNGLAEVIKYGWILDPSILEEDFTEGVSSGIVKRCIDLKRMVVEADEFETNGHRAILNFGHTVGHAIEQLTNYAVPHGLAVSMGMVAEAKIAAHLRLAQPGLVHDVSTSLAKVGLPTEIPVQITVPGLLSAMAKDKKALGTGNLAFSFVHKAGECKLHREISPDEVSTALETT